MEIRQNPFESAARLQSLLKKSGFQSIVIGGIAVSVWGEPRFTKDADLKVLLQREDAGRLLAALPPEYRLLSSEPEKLLQQLGFLFVEDASGVRLDLLLAETGFDAEAMTRGRTVEPLSGLKLTICAPEDLIIYKMISTRARDHEDVKGIVHRQGDALDDSYIEDWLRKFEQALDDSTLVRFYREMRYTN